MLFWMISKCGAVRSAARMMSSSRVEKVDAQIAKAITYTITFNFHNS